MIQFLRRLFSRTARRQIFRYRDGAGGWLYADPMVLLRRIDEHPTWNPATDLKLLPRQDEFGREAARATVAAIREIFEVSGLDARTAKGLTEDETLQLWIDFCEWQVALKKNGSSPPTSPPPTDSCPPAPDPATNYSSPSGSTDDEQLIAASGLS